MADAGENQQEAQRSGGSKETESRSIEETQVTNNMKPSGSGKRSIEKAVVRYDRDTRFWDEKMRDAEMRSNETESRSIEETKSRYGFTQENATEMPHELGQSSDEYPVRNGVEDCYYYLINGRCGFGLSCRFNHPPEYLESGPDHKVRDNLQKQQRLREAEMQQRRSRETESRFFQQKNREYECYGSRMNTGPIRDQNESYIRENQQQQQHIPRDFGMQQRRSHETESRFQQHKRVSSDAFDWRRSPNWGRFDEEEQWSVHQNRIKKGDCHFYLEKGWCGYGRDCVFNHPTHDFPPGLRFDERRHETEESRYMLQKKMARSVYGSESGSTWKRFDEGTESGYGENALEQRQRDNVWWQRRREGPEENVWEQRDSTGRPSYHHFREAQERDQEEQRRNEAAQNRKTSPEELGN